MKHHAVPGAEFYNDHLQRARAVPEAERSADVAAWLRCHDAAEAAAAALPEVPSDGSMLTQPAGGAPALAAVLQLLAHSFAVPPADPNLPCTTLRHLGPQLPPLMRVWAEGVQVRMEPQPQLASILTTGRLPGGEPDLALVARLLLLVLVSQYPGIQHAEVGIAVLQALKPALLGEAAAARLDGQLARLAQELASGSGPSAGGSSTSVGGSSGSGGGGAALPTGHQLQAVWHALSLMLAESAAAPRLLPPARVSAMAEQAARGLLLLQPDNPRSSFWMAKVAVMNHSLNPGSALRDPLPHLLRCVELARQQRNDFFLARGCWLAVMVASTDCSPLLSPAQAAGLLDEAAAAYARCKQLVPPSWTKALREEREVSVAVRPTLDAHLAASPQRWQGAIRAQQLPDVRARAQQVAAKHPEGQLPTCDACGLPSAALRRCSLCKARQYCSEACQKRDWKQGGHKQQCPQLAAAREAGSSRV